MEPRAVLCQTCWCAKWACSGKEACRAKEARRGKEACRAKEAPVPRRLSVPNIDHASDGHVEGRPTGGKHPHVGRFHAQHRHGRGPFRASPVPSTRVITI